MMKDQRSKKAAIVTAYLSNSSNRKGQDPVYILPYHFSLPNLITPHPLSVQTSLQTSMVN